MLGINPLYVADCWYIGAVLFTLKQFCFSYALFRYAVLSGVFVFVNTFSHTLSQSFWGGKTYVIRLVCRLSFKITLCNVHDEQLFCIEICIRCSNIGL